jgi:hypothetical protein
MKDIFFIPRGIKKNNQHVDNQQLTKKRPAQAKQKPSKNPARTTLEILLLVPIQCQEEKD